MIEIRYRDWVLEVDPAATAAAYRDVQSPTATCTCHWCANFVSWRRRGHPTEVIELLPRLGLDPDRESDVYQQRLQPADGTVLYRWFFFFRGRVLSGPQAWVLAEYDPDPVLAVTSWELQLLDVESPPWPFSIGFGDSPSRIDAEGQNVPPALQTGHTTQVECRAYVPWTVSESMPVDL